MKSIIAWTKQEGLNVNGTNEGLFRHYSERKAGNGSKLDPDGGKVYILPTVGLAKKLGRNNVFVNVLTNARLVSKKTNPKAAKNEISVHSENWHPNENKWAFYWEGKMTRIPLTVWETLHGNPYKNRASVGACPQPFEAFIGKQPNRS